MPIVTFTGTIPNPSPAKLGTIATQAPPSGRALLGKLADDTLVFRYFNSIAYSRDYGLTVTNGASFDDSNWQPRALMELPNGEVLVATYYSAVGSRVYRSTGWNPATFTATSWTLVKSAGLGVEFRGVWGLNERGVAPAWSKHAGMVFIAEYGTRAYEAATPDIGATHVYASSDYGLTWRTICDIRNLWPSELWLHVHAIAYDPWAGRLYLSQGDGGGAQTGHCGVWYTDNPEATAPTWTLVPGSATTSSAFQVTTIMPIETGIVLLPDGIPQAVQFIPRVGQNRIGALRTLIMISGSNDGRIGWNAHRNGGIADPQRGAPILLCTTNPSTGSSTTTKAAIIASLDGLTFFELYRHPTAITNNANGIAFAFGPDKNGKLIIGLNEAGSGVIATADYLPNL